MKVLAVPLDIRGKRWIILHKWQEESRNTSERATKGEGGMVRRGAGRRNGRDQSEHTEQVSVKLLYFVCDRISFEERKLVCYTRKVTKKEKKLTLGCLPECWSLRPLSEKPLHYSQTLPADSQPRLKQPPLLPLYVYFLHYNFNPSCLSVWPRVASWLKHLTRTWQTSPNVLRSQ